MRPGPLRRELQRLLDRLGLADEPAPPREIAVVLALRDGVPLRDVLDRLGVDTAPLDRPPPPRSVPFSRVAPGRAFSWRDHVWTRATVDRALAATPDRRAHPLVVAAYLAAVQRGRPATAFRWASGEGGPEPTCVAERVEADESVTLAAPATYQVVSSPQPAWVSMADQSPDLGRPVTVDALDGPVTARLLLADESPGGAVWHTAVGDHLDLDEVSRWRP